MDDFEVTPDGQHGLRLAGELDLSTKSALNEALAQMRGPDVVTLNLSDLTFIDSSGIHAIVAFALNHDGSDGCVVLEGVSAPIARLFEITNLTNHPNLEIRRDVDVE
jgi:anti-anti-sigma factor